jgi:hypothetical protein
MQAGQPTQLQIPTSGYRTAYGHLTVTFNASKLPIRNTTVPRAAIPFRRKLFGPSFSMVGPSKLREMASVSRTIMSRVPRKMGENEYGAELSEYLRDDQAVLIEWIRA